MKKTKKLFLFALAVTLFAVVFCFSASALEETGKCGPNATWNFNSETGELVISGEGPMIGELDGYYDEATNSTIYGHAPYLGDEVTSVVINEGITQIGSYQFSSCSNLKSVIIPESVTSIKMNAFRNCSKLEIVAISKDISINYDAFEGCYNIKKLYLDDISTWLGEGIKNIVSNYFFKNGGELYIDGELLSGTLIIPDGVERLRQEAFFGCKSITKVIIPDSVTEVHFNVFSDCENLEKVEMGNGINYLWSGFFSGCTSLKEFAMPDSVTEVGSMLFYECTALETVVLSNNLTKIGQEMFKGCVNLKNITIPESVTTIGFSSFADCTSLASITIPESVTTLESSCFANCTGFTSITLPDSLTVIGSYAFKDCKNLKTISISKGVTEIQYEAFRNCIRLEEITIPEKVTSISEGVFDECIRLSKITVENPDCVITHSSETFPENATLYGYEGSTLQTYAEDWNRKFVVIGSEEGGEGEGEVTPDIPHTHKFPEAWSVITTASCTQDGVSIRLCEGCNIFETQIEEAYGHSDNDGDGKCDECKVVLENSEPSVPSEPSEPEAPETEKEDANVFSFLTEFLNKLIDFLKSLFKIG